MNKKILVPAVLFAVVLIFAVVVLVIDKENKQPGAEANSQVGQQNISQIIFFYGDGCPHCANVEKYFKENSIKEKISFAEKEVYHNQQNSKELAEKAKTCGMPTDSIGVPFLWDGTKCLVGDQDIIEFFKIKTSQQ